MNKHFSADVRGIAHLAIIAVVVIVLAIAGVGYLVFMRSLGSTGDAAKDALTSAAGKLANAKCDYDDKDLCKFFTGWKETQYYRVTTETTVDGVVTTSVFETIKPDKSRVSTSGDNMNHEIITIGKTTYTKDQNDGAWWKQVVETAEPDEAVSGFDVDFKEPVSDMVDNGPVIQYKALGKEACGDLECFKYQVVDPGNADTTEYLWFDTKDYQLRRNRTENKDGTVTEARFSYEAFEINEPSPTKDMPTMPEPSADGTLPSDAEMQAALEALQSMYGNGAAQ